MTSLQYIMQTLRDEIALPSDQINYGITDGNKPPYVNVIDYEYEHVYQTCGPAVRHSVFHVVCVEADADKAQTLGEQVIGLLDEAVNLTPTTSRCLLEHYRIGQTEQNLYQFVVDIQFRLEETI